MQDLGYLLHRATSLLDRKLAARLHPLGLTPRQAAVLLLLRNGNPRPVGAVADALGVDRPTMTGLSERLARGGWVTTSAHPKDRRSRLLGLSPKSREILPSLQAAYSSTADEVASVLGTAEISKLSSSLERLVAALQDTPAAEGEHA